jgi:AcrR family transcriptional regulator
MPRKAGNNAESRQATRQALLQAGADLLVEIHMRDPFAPLKLRAICERAGKSTGAFYGHWKGTGDYFDELAELLAADDAFDDDFAVLTKAAEGSAEDSALTALARVADLDRELLLRSRSYDAMELLCVTLGRSTLRRQMAHGYRRFDRQTGEVYGAILTKYGREPRPPHDWDGIGVILQALLEGFTLRHKVDPEAVPPSSESALGPYAAAVVAVLAAVTRPAGDDASFSEAAEALLDGQAQPPGSQTATAAPPVRQVPDGRRTGELTRRPRLRARS